MYQDQRVRKRFGGVTALDGVDFSLEPGSVPHPPAAPRRAGRPRGDDPPAEPVLAELEFDRPLRTRLADLSLADRQLVEIARALLDEPPVLILDEPTSALPVDRAEHLLAIVDRLRNRGVAVLYVSHLLAEVMLVADRVTVLRDGGVVLTEPPDREHRVGGGVPRPA